VSKADEKDGNTEPDSFNTTTVSANLRLTPNDRFSIDARARTNPAATEFDGFGGPTGVIDSSDARTSASPPAMCGPRPRRCLASIKPCGPT
jgi:hypothetical protein